MPLDGNGLRRAVGEGALLLSLATALAFGVNARRKEPLPLVADPRVLALEVDMPVISAKGALAAFDAGHHVFLDARTYEAYRMGHIGGAFAVPAEDFGPRYETIGPLLAGGMTVVVYGWAAAPPAVERLAKTLLSAGVTDARFLIDGYEGWIRLQAPIEKGDDPTIEAPEGAEGTQEGAPSAQAEGAS